MDEVTKLVSALADLCGSVAWPAVLLFIVLRFRAAFGTFFKNVSDFSFKGGGIEASGKRQLDAAANLGAAIARSTPAGDEVDVSNVSATVSDSLNDRRKVHALDQAQILWVDDNPQNNYYERRAIEALGPRVTTCTSTDEALRLTEDKPWDLVISDMGRPPDDRAGYTLLDALRAGDDQTPYVIYAGSRSAADNVEARSHGALGTTNLPQELISLVGMALDRPG